MEQTTTLAVGGARCSACSMPDSARVAQRSGDPVGRLRQQLLAVGEDQHRAPCQARKVGENHGLAGARRQADQRGAAFHCGGPAALRRRLRAGRGEGWGCQRASGCSTACARSLQTHRHEHARGRVQGEAWGRNGHGVEKPVPWVSSSGRPGARLLLSEVPRQFGVDVVEQVSRAGAGSLSTSSMAAAMSRFSSASSVASRPSSKPQAHQVTPEPDEAGRAQPRPRPPLGTGSARGHRWSSAPQSDT